MQIYLNFLSFSNFLTNYQIPQTNLESLPYLISSLIVFKMIFQKIIINRFKK